MSRKGSERNNWNCTTAHNVTTRPRNIAHKLLLAFKCTVLICQPYQPFISLIKRQHNGLYFLRTKCPCVKLRKSREKIDRNFHLWVFYLRRASIMFILQTPGDDNIIFHHKFTGFRRVNSPKRNINIVTLEAIPGFTFIMHKFLTD